ncbi:YhcN/YlaJ family sporulation lipoprotein [Oceanobacillus damuensis]|uniref:YhcN/YlaJ family sporulation lipoprotein n=1 Tax=Oceanobacillus damuensis TaxID=937928 RepID=UPI00082AA21F|nr:YhcN/YlaJ family sporulation lipoprotein [Oceanobacillus damuensis]
MRSLFFIILVVTAVLSGCAETDDTMTEREQIVDELDPARNYEEPADHELNSQIGYVRYTKEQFESNSENQDKAITVDRHEMADMITRIILRNEGFDEVATLVTDQEVLIAYDRTEGSSEEEAADIATRTVMSIMPSYFDIYVSDNETLMYDLQSLHNSKTENRDYDNTINLIINEMQKSSQGDQNKRDHME